MKVPVGPERAELIQRSRGAEEARRRGYVPLEVSEGQTLLGLDENLRCTLLDDEGLCSIHKEFGLESKPLSCQEFPFYIAPTPNGFYLGASFLCYAVQNRLGRWVEEDRERAESVLASYLDETSYSGYGDPAVKLIDQVEMSWEEYLVWEEQLTCRLGEEDLFVRAAFEVLNISPSQDQFVFLYSIVKMVIVSAISLIEAGREPEITNQIGTAIGAGQGYYSPRLKQEVPVFHCPPVFVEEVRYYLEHVLFRKFLLRGDLIGQLLFMEVKARLLDFFTWQRAILRGLAEPTLEDYHQALITVEREVLHRRGQHPMCPILVQGFRTCLDEFKS